MTTRADYLDFDILLTEEQRLVRDTVGDWVDEKVLPIIEEAAWEGRFPRRSSSRRWPRCTSSARRSPSTACPGLDNVAYGLIMQELERGDSGPALLRLGAVGAS